MRVHYIDLAFIVLQGENSSIKTAQDSISQILDTEYSDLLASKNIIVVTYSNIAKNTFLRGVRKVGVYDSIESIRRGGRFY